MRNLLLLSVTLLIIVGCATSPAPVTPKVNEEELGRQAFDNGDYQGAVDCYNLWLAKYPESADVLFERGRAYNKLQKYDLALKDFETVIARNPADLRPQVYRCGILIKLKKTAAKNYLAKLLSDPKFQELPVYEKFLAYLLDGQLKNSQGDFENSQASLDEAMKVYASGPDQFQREGNSTIYRLALRQRAIAYYSMGNHHQAAADMEAYIQLTEKVKGKADSKDYQSLALVLYMTEEYDKCKKVIPAMIPQDRQALADVFGDFFIEDAKAGK